MATFKEVNKHLAELPLGEHKLIDIVNEIKSIPSKKHKTQVLLAHQPVTSEYISKCSGHDLKDVVVDITYQRALKLKKILDHLALTDMDSKPVGFDSMLCGTVEFAIRPNGKVYVWDGFRRCIIALLKGINKIPSNEEIHPDGMSDERCQKKEAFAFGQKNSATEPMKAEELFKSGVAQGNPKDNELKKVLVECELDILGVNYGKRKLSGFVEFQKLVEKQPFSEKVTQPSNDFVVEASRLIQSAWKQEDVSGFMLSGLAHFLHANEIDMENGKQYCISEDEIEVALDKYVKEKEGTQSLCTKDRLHSKARESVAWRICKNVLDMSSIDASKFIGMNDEQSEMLNVSGK